MTLHYDNRAPLSLEYNERPVDFSQFNHDIETSTSLERDHRFKGYPVGNFEKSRAPLQGTVFEVEQATPRKDNFHLPNWCNPNSRLPGIEKGQGFIYGSHEERKPASEPSLRKLQQNDKTSADFRRFRELEAEANYNIQQYKEEKKRKEITREEEKKRDLDMLKNYHPWGRPGGGAPRDDNRKKPFLEEELDRLGMLQDGENTRKLKEEFGDFGSYFGRPGHGAPLRTDSGGLKTQLRNDADIRFQNSEIGKHVNNTEVRYRQPEEKKHEYSEDLDRQLQERNLKEQEEKIQDLRREIETLKYDPFGKPGAGAPNKTKSGNSAVAMGAIDGSKLITPRSQILTNSIEEMRRHENRHRGQTEYYEETSKADRLRSLLGNYDEKYDPWGKGTGAPRRDSRGNVERYKISDPSMGVRTNITGTQNQGVSLNFENQRGGAGAPIKDDEGILYTRRVTNFNKNSSGPVIKEPEPLPLKPNDPAYAIHHPFGRPGAGAPLRDREGNLQTIVAGKVSKEVNNEQVSSADQRKKQAKQLYLYDLQNDAEQQKYNRAVQDQDLKHGGGELAAVIREGRVGHPRRDPATGFLTNHHLGTTDVTRQKADERKWKDPQSSEYHTELEREAEERRTMNRIEKLKDYQQERRHLDTLDTFYGRPGGGAPLPGGTKRPNFDNILYSPRKEPEGFYTKQIENGNVPYAYVKSTIRSNHKNMFEAETDRRLQQNVKNYRVPVPYATQEDKSLDQILGSVRS